MAEQRKKGYFAKHAKSSAAMISLGIHAVIIVLAVSFVAVTVINKPDQTFEQVKVNRPKVPLKKLQVPVKIKKKKLQQPKLRKRIVTKPTPKTVDIKMPEITGIKGGTDYMNGGGGLGSLGFGMEIPDLFGSNKSYGNELIGTLYDLKLTDKKEPVKMDDSIYFEALRNFCGSWNQNRLEDFFRAPKKKFSTVFYIPTMTADGAPKAFGVEKIVAPKYWAIHYKGAIAAPETGKYRFWGYGDDVLLVRVRKREVLQANWGGRKVTKWEADDEQNRKYKVFSKLKETLAVGDWISLKKGEEVPVEILLGECGGKEFSVVLMIEQQGVQYARGSDGRPILPVFKTKDISAELVKKMRINSGQTTVEGPSFGVARDKLKSGVSVGL